MREPPKPDHPVSGSLNVTRTSASLAMSDSGSSSVGEARMLERRVSNNRADLNGDQQMNYFLAWFNSWSELQRQDFIPVMADKMTDSGKGAVAKNVNGGLADTFKSLDFTNSGRPPSLFACQVKLFKDWFGGWSDDQKNYLCVRLRDIDADYFDSYELYVKEGPEALKEAKKDYFEPGIPSDLVQTPTLVSDAGAGDALRRTAVAEEDEDDGEGSSSLKRPPMGSGGESGSLSPISETA